MGYFRCIGGGCPIWFYEQEDYCQTCKNGKIEDVEENCCAKVQWQVTNASNVTFEAGGAVVCCNGTKELCINNKYTNTPKNTLDVVGSWCLNVHEKDHMDDPDIGCVDGECEFNQNTNAHTGEHPKSECEASIAQYECLESYSAICGTSYQGNKAFCEKWFIDELDRIEKYGDSGGNLNEAQLPLGFYCFQ